MKTVGALWKKEKEVNGKKQTYLTGEMDLGFGSLRIGIFKNDNKDKGKNTPDYRIVAFEFVPLTTAQKSDNGGEGNVEPEAETGEDL